MYARIQLAGTYKPQRRSTNATGIRYTFLCSTAGCNENYGKPCLRPKHTTRAVPSAASMPTRLYAVCGLQSQYLQIFAHARCCLIRGYSALWHVGKFVGLKIHMQCGLVSSGSYAAIGAHFGQRDFIIRVLRRSPDRRVK